MRLIPRTLIPCALACVFAAQSAAAQTPTPAPTPAAPSGPQKIVTQGLEVEFTIEPVKPAAGKAELLEDQDALVRIRVTDTATRSPLAGVKPTIWMTQRRGARHPRAV